jgi:hypothetical protein
MKNASTVSRSHRDPAEPQGSPVPWGPQLLSALLLVTAIGAAIYEAAQVARQERKVERLSQQLPQLQNERDEALKRVANTSTRRAPRLPAPALHTTVQPDDSSLEPLQSTNFYTRLENKATKLGPAHVEVYLKAHGRNAASLLTGYRTSGNAALLKEAMEQFPNDPHVAFEAVFAKDLPPEQRRQWLNAFQQSAPDNALANYLSAREYFQAGQMDQGVQELIAASGKGQFQDYTLSRRQDNEDAYLAAGYSIAEAKVIGSEQVELPQLAELKQLGLQMVELANSYRQDGDAASAQAVLQLAAGLGQSYSASDPAISHLVGIAIERIALGAMDPNSPYGNSGQTVQQRLEQLAQQKTAIAALFKENEPLLKSMSDQDWISYIDRDKSFGEEAALRWAMNKYRRK